MIVSHRHQFVFIKTRKTASTSIEIWLAAVCGPDDIITPIEPFDEAIRQERGYRGPQNYELSWWKHSWGGLYRLLRGGNRVQFYNHISARHVRELLGEDVWSRYFTFSFERNPWDKTISSYYYRYCDSDRPPTLSQFIMSDELEDVSDWHLYAEGEEILMDYVGRFEALPGALKEVLSERGIPSDRSLPHAKKGIRQDRRPYWEVLSDVERCRIAEVFWREIDHFGYAFGPPRTGEEIQRPSHS